MRQTPQFNSWDGNSSENSRQHCVIDEKPRSASNACQRDKYMDLKITEFASFSKVHDPLNPNFYYFLNNIIGEIYV